MAELTSNESLTVQLVNVEHHCSELLTAVNNPKSSLVECAGPMPNCPLLQECRGHSAALLQLQSALCTGSHWSSAGVTC